ncbi:tRNA1(Val) (adenine(37)-N6)-methyltransferase [Dinghuibacter silviterrae]|uniref:tRNA1(Val) (adenine(37)-N6)-methyltransferase n=1 Tax=Dinghuibacter silviterrae TaxID=1539049 RepID=A0A4R8DG20_9BACT|nr:methyltransferase [Dinghuibacter silviterrae]TDW96563.1 tRNA1Val (adenine37-N6)-methyltransferase [Dinghuibacter silviterrae]
MANPFFRFKQFTVFQDQCAMKVSTDACIFGAWMAGVLKERVGDESRVLDIGTGTGLLALMVAQQCPAFITGVEIQQSSTIQAASNMASSPWSGRLRVVPGDINDFTFSSSFDAIISNPPFFEDDLPSPEVGRNLARHGETLTFPQMLRAIFRDLTANGIAGVLIPFHRLDSFLSDALDLGFFCREQVFLQQTPAHSPFRAMLWLERQSLDVRHDPPTLTHQWIIKIGEDYGPECKELLKDYYLYL